MATKKTDPVVWDANAGTIDDALFDEWDDAQEEEAIRLAAAAADVKHALIEGKIFAGRFPDGTIVKTPLTFSVDDLETITTKADNPVDQVKELLALIGDEVSVKELNGQNLASVVIYAEKFFSMFEKITKVALGKPLSS